MKLYQGDCLEVMREIPNSSIDAIITDPPYGLDYQSQRSKNKGKWKPKILNDKKPFVWWTKSAFEKIKEGGCVISFCRFDSWCDFSRAFFFGRF